MEDSKKLSNSFPPMSKQAQTQNQNTNSGSTRNDNMDSNRDQLVLPTINTNPEHDSVTQHSSIAGVEADEFRKFLSDMTDTMKNLFENLSDQQHSHPSPGSSRKRGFDATSSNIPSGGKKTKSPATIRKGVFPVRTAGECESNDSGSASDPANAEEDESKSVKADNEQLRELVGYSSEEEDIEPAEDIMEKILQQLNVDERKGEPIDPKLAEIIQGL